MYIWKPRSTNSPTMNAVLMVGNPTMQNSAGNAGDELMLAAADSQYSCPPLSHSHSIFSFPRFSSTIIMIARTAQATTENAQINCIAREKVYDRIEREMAVRAARPMKPIPIPPYICHSGLKKKKYWPYLSKKIPPPRL